MTDLNFGTLVFNDEKEYFIALGTFCNSKAFSISYEPNKNTGSYADAYRMRRLSTATDLIKPIEKAIRTNGRINCNRYVEILVEKHNFVQSGKSIRGTLENVIKTVPEEFMGCFIEGYTKSASTGEETIVVCEVENIKATATSLEKAKVPQRTKGSMRGTTSVKRNKSKHDYIKEHIRNTDIGERGEKLVLEMETKKLKAAVEAGKISSMDKLIDWVSIEDDSAGYDILSYDVDAMQPMYIEVKTTTYSKMTPFYMSENELAFSKKNANHYHLYRVYNFGKEVAEYFELTGDVSTSAEVQIDAVDYLVSIK